MKRPSRSDYLELHLGEDGHVLSLKERNWMWETSEEAMAPQEGLGRYSDGGKANHPASKMMEVELNNFTTVRQLVGVKMEREEANSCTKVSSLDERKCGLPSAEPGEQQGKKLVWAETQ